MIANLVCPSCSDMEKIVVPKDKCLAFHKCKKCHKIIKAKTCCVICDYSDKKCPVNISKS